jgi:hypothetical protein
MRKLALVLALTLAAVSSYAADYKGRWTLDKTRSANLPPYYEQISGHELNISETDKDLVVAVKVTSEQFGADDMEFRYRLDGTAVNTEATIRTPGGKRNVPATLQLAREKDGALAITIERELPTRTGETVKGKTNETWKLDAEGKVLTIDRVDESPRGKQEAKMVFVRQ